MNYLELIKSFWRSHEADSFTTTEIALYFHLLETSNRCAWRNPFKRNNARICADLGVTYKTLVVARNKLIQSRLIEVRTINGSANTTYKLMTFGNIPKVRDEVRDEVRARLGVTKDKQNKTKLKKKEIDKEKRGAFAPPSISEVEIFIADKAYNVDAEAWWDFYQSKNWMIGKNKMKDWQAGVRTWHRKNTKEQQQNEKQNGTRKINIIV